MIKDKIDELIQKTASELDYIIYESSVLLKGENSKVVVKIDSLNGISHKDCEIYSKQLSNYIDDEELLGNYSLEVSSPGLKRKLRNIEEFERFAGKAVKIVYGDPENSKVVKGKLIKVVKDNIFIESENKEVQISYSDILKSNLDY